MIRVSRPYPFTKSHNFCVPWPYLDGFKIINHWKKNTLLQNISKIIYSHNVGQLLGVDSMFLKIFLKKKKTFRGIFNYY